MKAKGIGAPNNLSKVPSKGKAPLEITTLGGLSIRCDGQPIAKLHSRKAEALLVYLAVTGRPQPREVLADLLWEEFSQQRAMNNLRVVLSNLRKHLGDHLLITRDTAAMNPEMDYILDVTVLDANLSFAGEFERKSGTLNREAVGRIEGAVELYKGEFLSGFFVENALEFEAWMVVERERFHHIVLDGLGKLVRWKLAQGEYTAGIRHASKWVQLEPLSEAAHRQMMQLLAFSGQRSAALAQFDKCREILAEELGVKPDTRSTALHEQIREGTLTSDETVLQPVPSADTVQPDVRRHNLPVQTTPFIGRETELADLNLLLTNPDVRLVTVLGAGGMGKTRLALEAGKGLLDQFPDGVYFVSLTRLKSDELIVPSIIQALRIEFAGGGAGGGASPTYLKEILLRNIRRKQMLLILDNFEHLLDGVDLVGEINQTALGVKVLVTSRTRLNVGGEHRFQVGGMAYPKDIQDEEAQKYSAVRLFLESARRARSDFSPNLDEIKYIVKICHLVGGTPLGIRLAAAWVETLSPKEIAAEIVQSLDLLETELRDIPERHHSIRALFDHSWRLLSAREQDVIQSFSIFQGGCTREAAQEITSATLRDLRSLVDKSLLQRTLNGRFEMHELSREYATEKLDMNPESRDAVHSRHSLYYCDRVREWGNDLKSERQETALAEMDLEIENARAAWNWAVERRRADLLDHSMEGFRHYFDIRTRWQEAERTFHQAAESFKSGISKDELRIYARLISMQVYFLESSIRKQDLLQQSLKVFNKLDMMGEDVRFEKAQTQNFLGYNISNFEETIDLLQGSVALFKELGDRYWTAHALFDLGHAFFAGGKMADAEKNIQESKANLIELGDRRLSTMALEHYSLIYSRQGKFVKAERNDRERLEILEEIGDTSMIAVGQTRLGESLISLGEFDKAERLLEKALAVHKESENTTYFFGTLFDLCGTKIDLGKYVEAYNLAQLALDISSRLSQTGRRLAVAGWDTNKRRLGFSLTHLGWTSLALGKVEEAENFLQRSHESLQGLPLITFSAYHHILLGIVHLKFYRPEQAKEHIRDSFQIGVKIKSVLVHIPTLGAVALYLAYGGSLERAVEIYALASRYPLIAKSKWCQDVIGYPLTSLTASLSPEVIAAAQERGRKRDLDETVKELIAEFG